MPARVRVGGGLADLDLDGERRRGRTGLDWTTPGFDADAPHVDVSIRGGMSRVTLRAL